LLKAAAGRAPWRLRIGLSPKVSDTDLLTPVVLEVRLDVAQLIAELALAAGPYLDRVAHLARARRPAAARRPRRLAPPPAWTS
jgi:hypothetical protein